MHLAVNHSKPYFPCVMVKSLQHFPSHFPSSCLSPLPLKRLHFPFSAKLQCHQPGSFMQWFIPQHLVTTCHMAIAFLVLLSQCNYHIGGLWFSQHLNTEQTPYDWGGGYYEQICWGPNHWYKSSASETYSCGSLSVSNRIGEKGEQRRGKWDIIKACVKAARAADRPGTAACRRLSNDSQFNWKSTSLSESKQSSIQ